MIKKIVTYTDFNDVVQTDAFYFHISKSELLDNLALRGRLLALQSMIDDEARDLTESEVEVLLELIRDFIKLSYGIRSEDGKRFHKSEEEYQAFKESAAYDALLFGLFENPQSAEEFLTGVLPKDFLNQVKQDQELAKPQDRLPKKEKSKSDKPENVPFEGEVVAQKSQDERDAEIERLKAALKAQQN